VVMNGDGMVLRAAGGDGSLVVRLADKVRLANGWVGVAHNWTTRGVAVVLDPAYRPVVAGLVVWAVVAGDEDVATVLVSPTLAAARR
jgi:hypothetical protein